VKQNKYKKRRKAFYGLSISPQATKKRDMELKRILFISGSLGLGHVGRDVEIARALRKSHPDLEISWMAESPASDVLKRNGEKLLPEAELLFSSNSVMEESAKEYKANLVQWAMNVRKGWAKNGEVYTKISDSYDFDLWIGDEPYDIMIAMVNNQGLKKCPFVVVYDFLGLDASTWNPIDHVAAYMTNRLWLKFLKSELPLADKSFFIGELEDVPDRGFGLMLPNRRKIAEKFVDFVGYIVPEDIEKYRDKLVARQFLGYEDESLIVCSIGGTAAGKELLGLCIKAYPLIKSRIPNVRMILVCGPRLSTEAIKAPQGVDVLGYVPNLYRHMGAADLCIVSGGGTITLELTALEKPFLYFPLEQHFEQEVSVANRCQRHGAGVKMICSMTTPELLAEAVFSNIDKEVDYARIPIDGSKEIAKRIKDFL
jgi:UDP-N-acetylglucosamine:LPS N-acetylglucosamine transferase